MELLNTRMFHGIVSGLAKHMDIILLSKDTIIYNKPLESANTIFINTRLREVLILYFIDTILPKLTKPIHLIIAGEDYTFPNNTDKRMDGMKHNFKALDHKYITKIFVENLDTPMKNTFPIPLGINPKECRTSIDYFLKHENIVPNKPLKITNFNRTRNGKGQWAERGHVNYLCRHHWKPFFVETIHQSHESYLKEMGKYMFTVCVHGGGLDVNPKLWEALLIGVIPILKENKPYTDLYKTLDFPVVIVKEWEQVNLTNLLLWSKKYRYFTEKRKQMLYQLSLQYWIEYVS